VVFLRESFDELFFVLPHAPFEIMGYANIQCAGSTRENINVIDHDANCVMGAEAASSGVFP